MKILNRQTTPGWGLKKTFMQILTVCCVLLVCFWLDTMVAMADKTFIVNSTVDSVDAIPGNGVAADSEGRTTLRAAIMEANALGGEHTIILPTGTYTLTIPGRDENNCETGDLDITTGLTIIGGGGNPDGNPAETIIQAGTNSTNGIDKVITINPTWDKPFNTAIKNVTIRYGRNTSDYEGDGWGGGLSWDGGGQLAGDTGGNLILYNTIITQNYSQSGPGGGLDLGNYNGSSSVSIDKCIISDNKTDSGKAGGISIVGHFTVNITNSQIINNVSDRHENTSRGGGIYAEHRDILDPDRPPGTEFQIHNPGLPMTISNTIISNNTANIDAGGIFSNVPLTITDSTISGNESGDTGGGLSVILIGSDDTANLQLENVSIINNIAGTRGGGLNIGGSDKPQNINLTNVTLSGNRAGDGAGLHIGGNFNPNATITNSTISQNASTGAGGGINISLMGIPSEELALENVSIWGNTAGTGGGGLHIEGVGSPNIKLVNVTLSGNSAKEDGGGLLIGADYSSAATLTNVTITDNRSDSDNNASGSGGGIYTNAAGTPTLSNTIVADNFKGAGTEASDIDGSGVSASSAYNLIGTGGAGGLAHGTNGNLVGISDPRLGPLADNGGLTLTHALLAGSPALDGGSNALIPGGVTTDQRGTGFVRILDAADGDTIDTVDIGALEAHPSVEDIGGQTIDEDTAIPSLTFNVGDADQGFASITAISDNTTLVPNDNIGLSGSGSTRSLNITPAADKFGSTTITVSVSSNVAGTTQTMTDTFLLTVNPVPDPPAPTGTTTAEDTQSTTGLVINRNPEDGDEVTHFKVTGITGGTLYENDGVTVIHDNDFITVAGGGAGLKFMPMADLNTPAGDTFQFVVQAALDNIGTGISTGTTVTITVTEVNDPPLGVNDTLADILEDSGARTIPFATLLANDAKGPANESGQTLTITAVDGAAGGTVSISGSDVIFMPSENYSGPAGFTYTVSDDGTTNGLPDPKTDTATVSFNITPMPDPPAVTGTVTNEDTQSTTGLVISRSPLDGDEVTHFKVTGITGGSLYENDGITEIHNGDFITVAQGEAGLKFTPMSDLNTSAGDTFEFIVQSALDGSGTGISTGTTVNVIVNAVNDPPSFIVGPSQVASMNAGNQSIANWATSIFKGAANESAQSLTFIVIENSNAALFSVQPAISPDGTLTYTPASGASGSATVSIVLKDDGGTENGGNDTSGPQSFTIKVLAANGSGSMTLPPTTLYSGQTGVSLTFTYTADVGGLEDGEVTITVPEGWSAPAANTTAPGYTTAGAGTVSISGRTVIVAGLTLVEGESFEITYGDRSSGGTGAAVSVTLGTSVWQTRSRTTTGGNLEDLAASPETIVVPGAADPDVSSMEADTDTLSADNMDTAVITVMIKDSQGNPLEGHTVILDQGEGHSTVNPANAITNTAGEASFEVKSLRAETVTYKATDTTDGVTVTESVTVVFRPGIIVAPTSGSTVEGGTMDYTVALVSQPTEEVTVNIIPDDQQLTVNKNGLSFTLGNYNTPQTVTVTVKDNQVEDGDRTGIVSHAVVSGDPQYDSIAVPDVEVSIIDNDTVGIIIIESGGSTEVTEGGNGDSYTIFLTTQPMDTVMISVYGGNQIDISPLTLTFTAGDWNQPREVMITAVDDDIAEGPHTATVTHRVYSDDPAYHGFTIPDITVSITDNDSPGISIAQSGGFTEVVEGGNKDTYTIVLTTQPSDDVEISISSCSQLGVNPTRLTFTPGNWNEFQTVWVWAIDDMMIEGEHTGTVMHSVYSSDSNYNNYSISNITVRIIDNDAPDNAYLSGLAISSGTLTPAFSPAVTNYTAGVPNGVSSVTATPVLMDSGAVVTINGKAAVSGDASDPIALNIGNNIITIVVTAQDGRTIKTYTININRADLPDDEDEGPGNGGGGNSGGDNSSGDGGSSGSGNSGRGGSGTPIQSPASTPATDSNGTITAVPKLDKNTGIAVSDIDAVTLTKAFEKVPQNNEGIKTVRIEIPKADNARSYEIILPAGLLSSDDANRRIQVSTNIAAVTLPENMLVREEAANAEKVSLIISQVDASVIGSEETRSQIGDRPIIQLSMKIDGKPVTWSNEKAPVTVSIPYIPTAEELTAPEHITVWYIDGAGNVIEVPSGKYDPATGTVTFSTTHFSHYAAVYVTKTFDDLESAVWARKQIEVLASKGILRGISETEYAPQRNITRADFLYFLVRTLGVDAKIDGNFEDISRDAYYYKEIGIAKKLGITGGTGNNKFSPDASITRQDMMVLTEKALRMLKVIKEQGIESDIAKFADKALIAPYAKESIAALIKEELIFGEDNRINPLGNTTRAEAAAFLYKIYNLK